MLQDRVERELAAFGASASWLDYRLYLCRMYGFLVPVERALADSPDLAQVIEDAGARNTKAALLAHDLASLGVDRGHLGQIPRMAAPLLEELPEALGWMYVVESSTLEGEALASQLSPRLMSELDGASAYLHCYGREVHARWRDFTAALDGYVDRADVGACDRIVLAATDGLIRLHRWIVAFSSSALPQVRAGRIHA